LPFRNGDIINREDVLHYLGGVISGHQERFDFRMAFDFAGTRMGARGQELVG
jgi:hypothetical protein